MKERLHRAGKNFTRAASRARALLRRVMPRVALAFGALVVLKVFFGSTPLFGDNPVGVLLDFLLTVSAISTFCYYALKALRWLKRHLLWRVRRRLAITYLFVGLTPIVLLVLLGLLLWTAVAPQTMSRLVAVQAKATERQTLASARSLLDSLDAMPENSADKNLQAWLDERTRLMQGTLPGVSVAVWRGATTTKVVPAAAGNKSDDAATLDEGEPARFVYAPQGEDVRGVGGDATPPGAPLPAWLSGREEWSGFVYVPPDAGSKELFSAPSFRALVRRKATQARPAAALLVVVPVSRALVAQFRESTGVYVRPYFPRMSQGGGDPGDNNFTVSIDPDEEAWRESGDAQAPRGEGRTRQVGLSSRDQFGEELPRFVGSSAWPYPVLLPATNWVSGAESARWSFMVDFSSASVIKQLLGDNTMGEFWRQALAVVAVTFLVLELVALLAAGWMTRAVTGTVHKLYRATEFIKGGDFSHRIKTRSRDQLGELAAAFNDMSANIESLLHERVKHERLEREVEIAAEVQAQLFPRGVPELASVEVAGECRAARGVAGDYYDYIEVAPGLVAFALGDVSGKGLSASLVMSNLQATLRAQTTIIAERLKMNARVAAATAGVTGDLPASFVASAMNSNADADSSPSPSLSSPSQPCGLTGVDTSCAVENMVESINGQLCRSTESNRFATLFLALYDDAARTLRYTNAGHNDALLVRAGGTVERLSKGGTMVGAFDWSKFEEGRAELAPGDLLFIFSDGISEAQSDAGEEYGERRLADFAVEHRRLSADELRRAVFDEIDKWSGAQERGDDQTLVIVKSKEG